VAALDNRLTPMKKYLTVGYAYPVYLLLILGQYFLAEGLDSLYNTPEVTQPVQELRGTSAASSAERGGSTALASLVRTDGKGR
jgi:hypothetical protein